MNNMKKAVIALAVAVPIIAAPTAAFAASQQVGGGTWNWGNAAGHNYSDYFHSTRTHSSTVICGGKTSRVVAAKSQWSNASLYAISGCGFYWNNAA